jgi:NAD(P)-dependent dehydrogenase (short-subunit alcohol dehydrogenase family)
MYGHTLSMVVTRTRRRTAAAAGTFAAFILVLVFGSPIFVDWVNQNTRSDTAGGLFLRTLAWPAWSFNSDAPVRDVLAQDLKAILFILFVGLFLTLLAGAELSRARGTLADVFNGWGAVIFAAAVAGLLTAFLSVHAGLYTALLWALSGAGYGLITGWIIAVAQMGTRRP